LNQGVGFATKQSFTTIFLEARAMQGQKRERWMELAAQAAVEQDPKKLIDLVRELNDLLEEKERRLGILPPLDLTHPKRGEP
jgi:hypothetical protein